MVSPATPPNSVPPPPDNLPEPPRCADCPAVWPQEGEEAWDHLEAALGSSSREFQDPAWPLHCGEGYSQNREPSAWVHRQYWQREDALTKGSSSHSLIDQRPQGRFICAQHPASTSSPHIPLSSPWLQPTSAHGTTAERTPADWADPLLNPDRTHPSPSPFHVIHYINTEHLKPFLDPKARPWKGAMGILFQYTWLEAHDIFPLEV